MLFTLSCRSGEPPGKWRNLLFRVPGTACLFRGFPVGPGASFLEQTDESQIGVVRSVQVAKDRIFVLDASNVLFEFSRDGSYVGKLDRLGRGPEEYMMIMSFEIQGSGEERRIAINDPVNRRLQFYDLDFRFLESMDFPFPFFHFHALPSGTLVLYRALMGGAGEQFNQDLMLRNPETGEMASYFPYTGMSPRNADEKSLLPNETGALFHTNYSDVVLSISDKGRVDSAYHITFGPFEFPEADYLRSGEDGSLFDRSWRESDLVYRYCFREIGESVFLAFVRKGTRYTVLQDAAGKQVFSEGLRDDFGYGLEDGWPDFFDGDRVGFVLYPYILQEKRKEGVALHASLEPVRPDANPVLVLFDIRSTLQP
ncbi:MAG: 6-bladed beta-propeller [Bacteroidales bacterium]